jgi:hypothetical protein
MYLTAGIILLISLLKRDNVGVEQIHFMNVKDSIAFAQRR